MGSEKRGQTPPETITTRYPSHSVMTPQMAFTIPPSVRFHRHEHEGPHLCFVLAGGFLEQDNKSWVDVGPGSFRVSGAARHDINFGPAGARCLVLERDDPDWAGLARARFFSGDPWLLNLAHRFSATLDRPDPAATTAIDTLTAELRAQVRRRLTGRGAAPPRWLEKARTLISGCRGIAVSDIAAHVGVHRAHLARAFHDHYGATVTEYARHVRISRAQRLLCGSSLPLSQVAAEAGFADQAHMTRALRLAAGVTPGALRRATLHRFNTGHHAAS